MIFMKAQVTKHSKTEKKYHVVVILILVGLDLRELWRAIHGKIYIRYDILYVINLNIYFHDLQITDI